VNEGDGVDAAFLVPGDGEEIVDAAPESIPYSVLGNASQAGPMVDRHLKGLGAVAMDDDGQEPMNAVKREHALEASSLVSADAAAGISKVDLQGFLPGPARHLRRDFPHPTVLPFHALAADKINLIQMGQHGGQIRGIVLAIAVEGGDDWAVGRLDAGPDGGALAGIELVAKANDARVLLVGFGDGLPGVVGTGVVDEHDLERPLLLVHGGEGFGGEGQDIILLVIDRNEDGDVNRHRGSVVSVVPFENMNLRGDLVGCRRDGEQIL